MKILRWLNPIYYWNLLFKKKNNKEIEHKYLVRKELLDLSNLSFHKISQGYLCSYPVIRIRTSGKNAYITIKGSGNISRDEYEYKIPFNDALNMLNMCQEKIVKTRYIYKDPRDKKIKWEIDVFGDQNDGLILAEVEIPSEDYQYSKPKWVGDNVSEDFKYANVNLAKKPYKLWENCLIK